MDEQLQKDIISILMKGNRPDLVALMMTIFEDLDDSDYEEEEVKERKGTNVKQCNYGELKICESESDLCELREV